ncbi:MAG TPA: Ig-like domain-containing protein, partial [Chthoniobacteraceae bacterium]|nr:Ig-like domain-containing protein [Chthoniobacteraceae bacterium]
MNLPFPKTFRKVTHRLRYLGCWLKKLRAPSPGRSYEIEARRRRLTFQPLEPRVLLSSHDLLDPNAAPGSAVHALATPPRTLTSTSPLANTMFTDGDGDTYQVKLTGPGSVDVQLGDVTGDSKDDVQSLTLHGTTEKSTLTVLFKKKAAAGDGEVAIGALLSDAGNVSLGSFTAAKSDLVGAGISVGGTIDKVTLDDLRNGADIKLPGSPAAATTKVSLTLGDVGAGSDLAIKAGVGAVTVASAGTGHWSAASFGSGTAKGTFSATVDATATAAALGKTLAIGKFSVTGGNFNGALGAAGNIGPVSVTATKGVGGAIVGASIAGNSLTSLTAGAFAGDLVLSGTSGAITVKGNADGNWTAQTFGAISVTGGALSARINATGHTALQAKKPVITSVTVTGGFFVGNITATLDVGAITVSKTKTGAAGTAGTWTARTFKSITVRGGSLFATVDSTGTAAALGKTLAIGKISVTGGDLTGRVSALGDLGPVSVAKDTVGGGAISGATLTAHNFGTVSATGDVGQSLILAGANLGSDHAPGGLGTASDSFNPGNIASFTAGSVSQSTVGAGLSSSDSIIGNEDDELLGFGASTVKAFSVKGQASADSLFAALSFPKTVKIGGVTISPAADSRFLTTGSADRRKPFVTAGLASDTGASATDGITSVATVSGMVSDNQAGVQLTAALDSGSFSSVTVNNGAFTLTKTDLEAIKGGTLTDGRYTLHLQAKDAANNVSTFNLIFTLDTTLPSQPSLALSSASQTGQGDQLTSASVVTLTGTAEPNAKLTIGSMVSQATGAGAFSFPNVTLVDGSNTFAVSVKDIAGNETVKMVDITRSGTLASGDVVLQWNAVNLEAIRLDSTPPPVASRGMAMVSAAIYDVVNGFEGTPGLMVSRTAPAGASLDAAITMAAHTVLAYLFPGQQALFNATRDTSLAGVADGQSKEDGKAFGVVIAQAIIDLRAGDGFDQYVDYTPGTDVGDWQETGPMYAPALLPNWATLTPFVMSSPDAFRPDGPPALDSQEWADDLNKTESLGAQTGSTRTADQTQIARFWADGGATYTPPGHWDQIAASVAQQRGNSVSANARMMAELNLAMADAGIVAWDAKYAFNWWRPVTAIQNADLDGNDQTTADPNWQSFLITPNFPEYISGHSTFSGAAATVLTDIFGDNTAFSATSIGLPNVTRNFTSFQQAADEAGESRIYGGIHYEFSDQDGLAAGRALGALVVDRFKVEGDVNAPQVKVDAPPFNVVTSTNITVQGRAFDDLSGLDTLTAQLDAATPATITVDAQGHFSIPLTLAVNGSADGAHTLQLIGTDLAGNKTTVNFPFTLDTKAPLLTVDTPVNGAVDYLTHVTGVADATGSMLTALGYKIDSGNLMPITFDPTTGAFDQVLDLSTVAAGPHTLTITATDAAGLSTPVTRNITLAAAIPFTITHATPAADAQDVGTTFRPQVFFSRPVNGATLNANNFYATDSSGAKIPATIVPSNDGSFAWLFFTNPMPTGATVTVHVDGATIMSAGAAPQGLDGDFDGLAGGKFEYSFSTVSLVKVAGTSLSGIVLDPGADLKPMTFDDMRAGPDGILHTADDIYLNRLANVKVFIVGLENEAVYTDAMGRFSFPSVPVGDVKLAIDGRTATNAPAGFYFPEMVMDLTLQPGRANTAMDTMGTAAEKLANTGRPEVFLPRLQTSILQPVSTTDMTMVNVDAISAPNLTPTQRDQLQLEVQPNSLVGFDGQMMSTGMVGISTVPPELVRDMLPPGLLQHTFDITIQAPGVANFAQPLQITFPNVFNSAPGTKLNFLSFDHTTGMLVIEGTATVSADGLSATTDPGMGITKPGWHGLTPPGDCGGAGAPPPPPPPPPAPEDTTTVHDPTVLPLLFAETGNFPTLTWSAPARLPDAPPPPPPPPGCAVPPRPPDGDKQQPFLSVNIQVDGPLAKFMVKTGNLDLASQAFTLSAGQGGSKTFGGDAKNYFGLYGADGIKTPLDNELYGSQIKVTEIRGNPDGSRSYDYYTYYLYRFVNATDNTPDDHTVEYENTLADGTGGTDRNKFIVLKTGGASTPTIEKTAGNDFDVVGGGVAYTMNFDPSGEGLKSAQLAVKTPEGTTVPGTITLAGNGELKQHIFVDKASLEATLKQMAEGNEPQELTIIRKDDTGSIKLFYNGNFTAVIPTANPTPAQIEQALNGLPDFKPGDLTVTRKDGTASYYVPANSQNIVTYAKTTYKITFAASVKNVTSITANIPIVPAAGTGVVGWSVTNDDAGGITADEKKYFDNLEDDGTTPKPDERADLATAVADRILSKFSGFADGIDSGSGDHTITIKFRTTETTLLGDSSPAGGIDREGAIKAAVEKRDDYNEVVQNFILDNALNQSDTGTVEAYPDSPLEANAHVTRAQFINTLAKSSAHEVGHTLGLTHTYKYVNGALRQVDVGGVTGDLDLMRSGEDLGGSWKFQTGLTAEAIRMALNLGYTTAQGQAALAYKVEYYRIGAFDTEASADDPDTELDPFTGAHLAVFNADTGLLAGSDDFGNTLVDGLGGQKSVM